MRALSTVAIVAALMGSAASAQALREARPPAEFPPADFTANQYVDSRGCVYVRAGIGGSTEWVPRVSRTREQLCGFQPTQVAGTTTVAPSADAPNPLDTPVAGLPARTAAPVETPIETPVAVAAAPAVTPAVRPEAAPVVPQVTARNPLATPRAANPAPTPTVAAASVSPRVISAPVVAAPRTLTRAQACDGLTGIQPHLVSQRTGQPIDCGGATPAVTAAAPRTLTRAQACEGLTGLQPQLVSQRTGQPIDCGGAHVAQATTPSAQTAVPTTLRMTRAQACARTAATGQRFINAQTGQPVQCATQVNPLPQIANTFDQLRDDFTAPQTAYSNPLDMAPGSTFTPNRRPQVAARSPARYSNPLDMAPGSTADITPTAPQFAAGCARYGITVSAGADMRCGPQTQSPSSMTAQAQPATVTRAQTAPASDGLLAAFGAQSAIPASNPTVYSANTQVPDGYARVWDDGRLNTQRGLPTAVQAPVASPARVSTRTAPTTTTAPRVEQISGDRYVQVGTFASRAEAQSVARALRGRGLPMRIGVFEQNGQQLRLVLAGPFGTEGQLRSALSAARNAGFSGAFTRR